MNVIDTIINNQGGFIKEEQLPEIIAINRFQQLLVRCGNGRFLVPAQDAKHFIDIVEASKLDHVRDVSLLAR
jgi:hypothetical protein